VSIIPRARMFAGPNGSGKSTIRKVLPEVLLGIYVNPDEIQKEIQETGFFDLAMKDVSATTQQFQDFVSRSSLFLGREEILSDLSAASISGDKIVFGGVNVNGYVASVTSDFLRHLLLEAGISFSFETVMSSRDKIEFLRAAQAVGYRTYLYYVATEDPEINVNRVENRVKLGGHSVEAGKIRSRYTRSLDLLFDALQVSDRAYIFDNSSAPGEDFLVAELGEETLTIQAESVPAWFKQAVLNKIQ